MKPWMVAAVLLGVGTGCFQVINGNVTGPHGEHLIELQCPSPAECMDYARQTCGGDFDIVTNQTTSADKGGTSEYILVQCQSALAAPGSNAARDAGP